MESSLVILLGGALKAEATFRGQLKIVRMKRRPTIMGECCTLGVCFTQC